MVGQRARGRLQWEIETLTFDPNCDIDQLCDQWPLEKLGHISLKELQDALSSLAFNRQQVLIRRYGLDENTPRKLKAIAQEADRTAERIRQVEFAALLQLYRAIKANRTRQ